MDARPEYDNHYERYIPRVTAVPMPSAYAFWYAGLDIAVGIALGAIPVLFYILVLAPK